MAVNKRRDRHDIVAEILNHAIREKTKAHITYRAKLGYNQLSEYLPLLVKKGFLENMTVKRGTQTTKMYRTTQKGIKFLNRLESANKLWESREPLLMK